MRFNVHFVVYKLNAINVKLTEKMEQNGSRQKNEVDK